MNAHFPYIRVSGLSQADGDGPERQLDKIVAAATSEGAWEHSLRDNVHEDIGVSGTKDSICRPGLSKLLGVVQKGDTIWIERSDRLARDSIVSEMIIRELQALGVRLMSADGKVDLTAGDQLDPMSKLIRQLLAAIAEFDKDSTVQKLRRGRERKKAQGFRMDGRKPYGERAGEQAILMLMLQLSAQGKRPAQIAVEFNDGGLKTRKGTKWNPGTIYKILKAQEKLSNAAAPTESNAAAS